MYFSSQTVSRDTCADPDTLTPHCSGMAVRKRGAGPSDCESDRDVRFVAAPPLLALEELALEELALEELALEELALEELALEELALEELALEA